MEASNPNMAIMVLRGNPDVPARFTRSLGGSDRFVPYAQNGMGFAALRSRPAIAL